MILGNCYFLLGGLLALALLRGIGVTRLLKEWAGLDGKNLERLSPKWREAFFMGILSGGMFF